MESFLEFEEKQKRLMRSRIVTQMNKLQINSFHDLYQRQNLIIARKLKETENSDWVELSRNSLYQLNEIDTNPELNTLLKICFLLDLECKNLFEEGELDDE